MTEAHMKSIRILPLLLLILFLFSPAALSEPLRLSEDLSGEVSLPLNDTGEITYTYAWSYPQVDETDPSAGLINEFYRYKVSDALDFEVPMMADYYASQENPSNVSVRISYEITCNNDDYFSVLLRSGGDDYVSYYGHTFSRKDIKPGSSVALPYLLGILKTDESDTWLQDRQTARADELVRSLLWQQLEERRQELGIHEDFTREILDISFYPEEDFYLDAQGNPVFYLEPGIAADPSKGLLTFPITLWEIRDEM